MTERQIATESGYSPGMVHRKLKVGHSPIEIIEQGKARDAAPKRPARPGKSKQVVSGYGKQPQAKSKPSSSSDAESPDLTDETEDFLGAQRRKEIALADLRELELAQKRSELVPSTEVEIRWAAICTTIRDGMLSLPTKLSDKLAAMTNEREIAAFLRTEIRAELSRVSGSVAKLAEAD